MSLFPNDFNSWRRRHDRRLWNQRFVWQDEGRVVCVCLCVCVCVGVRACVCVCVHWDRWALSLKVLCDQREQWQDRERENMKDVDWHREKLKVQRRMWNTQHGGKLTQHNICLFVSHGLCDCLCTVVQLFLCSCLDLFCNYVFFVFGLFCPVYIYYLLPGCQLLLSSHCLFSSVLLFITSFFCFPGSPVVCFNA